VKLKNLKMASLTAGLIAISAMGQSPINDTLVVTFPNSVRVGTQTLNAGEYTIRQLSSASNSRLLEFSTDKGTSIQASATSIPALDNNNRNDSSVLLVERGGLPQLHKIWIKGKSYGYEFPVDKNGSNDAMTANNGIRLTANYTAPATATATLGNEAQPDKPSDVLAVATPEPSRAPVAEPEPAQAAVQNPAPEPSPAAAQSPVVAEAAPAASSNSQDLRTQNTPEMPKTATNWMLIVLSGFGVLSLGVVIRTYAQRL